MVSRLTFPTSRDKKKCDSCNCGDSESATDDNGTGVARNETEVMKPHPGGKTNHTIDWNQGLSFGDGE